MRILITGVCGFVGSWLARELLINDTVIGLDNFSRPGSEFNRGKLQELGVQFYFGDIRNSSDFESLPKVDWVIDCAANPSVLAGVDGNISSRQLMEHNLLGTLNTLEYCKKHACGLIMISTSRVYSLDELCKIPVEVKNDAYKNIFKISGKENFCSDYGLKEDFSTDPPLSLYGSAKRASELLVLEYSNVFEFPVYINRCGVLAGDSQFGKPDQGIFSYWIHSWYHKKPLKYIGFGGDGHQVRDCLHPVDLYGLIIRQFDHPITKFKIYNVSGGEESAMSLKNLSKWCENRFGPHQVVSDPNWRKYDAPYIVLDNSLATEVFNWNPLLSSNDILESIATFAEKNKDWLNLSNRN